MTSCNHSGKTQPMRLTKAILTGATLGAVLLGLAAPAAWAQIASRNDAPLDISADRGELVKSKCMGTWAGDVEVLQDKTRLRSQTLRVYYATSAAGCGQTFDRLEADGQVYYVTPQQTARGDKAVYTASSDNVVLTGNVILVQGKNVMRGDRLTVNSRTGEAQIESSAKGLGAPGRVRAVLFPNSSKP